MIIMTISEEFYFEALKRLEEWSITVLVLQVIVFIVLASLCLFIDNNKIAKVRLWLTASVTFSAISILFALNVIGTIPWSTQRLPELSIKYQSIYQFPNYIGIPIWILAFSQHISFLFALLSFIIILYILIRSE